MTRARVSTVVFGAAILILMAFGAFGCGGDRGGTINVFAAASLIDAFEEMRESFEEENPEAEVRLNFAGSSTLLTQIQQGAPADVFASADEEKMDAALEDGLVEEPRPFVTNELVVIVPEGNPAGIGNFEDLANEDVTLVLAEEGVPVAEYTEELLQNADAEFGEGFSEDVFGNIASREADVKVAANRVSLDEADATFVYESDITPDIEERIEVIEVPPALNVVATYPIAAATGTQNAELSNSWVEFVFSEEGQSILEEWGFDPA